MLTDDEWKKFPIRKIARLCAVDEGTVRNHIKKLSAEFPQIEKPTTRTVERNGTVYEQDTSNIGKTPDILPSSEPASVNAICKTRKAENAHRNAALCLASHRGSKLETDKREGHQ